MNRTLRNTFLTASALFCIFATVSAAAENEDKKQEEGKELKAKVYYKDGKFNIATTDGKFRLWFDNRIYTDASIYIPTESVEGLTSKVNKDLEDDDGIFRFNNGVSVRRARLAFKAELSRSRPDISKSL